MGVEVGCRGGVRLSGRSGFLFNHVTASSEATGDLVSYSAKSEEKRHRTTPPLISAELL